MCALQAAAAAADARLGALTPLQLQRQRLAQRGSHGSDGGRSGWRGTGVACSWSPGVRCRPARPCTSASAPLAHASLSCAAGLVSALVFSVAGEVCVAPAASPKH